MIAWHQRAVARLVEIEEISQRIPPPTVRLRRRGRACPTESGREQPLVVFQGVNSALQRTVDSARHHFRGWRGELVAITGPSGGARAPSVISSHAYMMSRPAECCLMVSMCVISRSQELRGRVAVVPQETFFSFPPPWLRIWPMATGRPPETIHGIAMATCLWESIQAFRTGSPTLVGERASRSPAARSSAWPGRALLYGGEVLVLDDPSPMSTPRPRSGYSRPYAPRPRAPGAAESPTASKHCRRADSIIVVADGCIVADGTHQQLLAQGGLYRIV